MDYLLAYEICFQPFQMEELKKWNPRCSFPTIVINDSKCIVGFKEDDIKEAVKA